MTMCICCANVLVTCPFKPTSPVRNGPHPGTGTLERADSLQLSAEHKQLHTAHTRTAFPPWVLGNKTGKCAVDRTWGWRENRRTDIHTVAGSTVCGVMPTQWFLRHQVQQQNPLKTQLKMNWDIYWGGDLHPGERRKGKIIVH